MMKATYQFTMALGNVDEHTPHLEDALYEAACDDALIHFKNGAVYLEFDRAGNSLEEVIISAINAIEKFSMTME